jgi:hypothetical protein
MFCRVIESRASLGFTALSSNAWPAPHLLILARTDKIPEHLEYISPHFDVAVCLVAPRYRYFCNGKSFFVSFCYKVGIERKTITVDAENVTVDVESVP